MEIISLVYVTLQTERSSASESCTWNVNGNSLVILILGVGPGNNDDTLLSAVASALHTSSAPITGQLSAAVEKNPAVWLNTSQPLCKAFIVTDDDIRWVLWSLQGNEKASLIKLDSWPGHEGRQARTCFLYIQISSLTRKKWNLRFFSFGGENINIKYSVRNESQATFSFPRVCSNH